MIPLVAPSSKRWPCIRVEKNGNPDIMNPPSADPPTADMPDRRSSHTVLVADAKPLSLLATAGVLHHEGMRCLCARDEVAVLKVFGLPPKAASETFPSETRVDEGHAARSHWPSVDLIVWDVGSDPATVLDTLGRIRDITVYQDLPAVLIAEPDWAGLEKKTESLRAATACLFKPIDPRSLVTIASHWSWMPGLQTAHRNRGGRPQRPGWVTL